MTPTAVRYPSTRVLYLATEEANRAAADPQSSVSALLLAVTAFEAFMNDLPVFIANLYETTEPWETRAFGESCSLLEERRQPVLLRLRIGLHILTHNPCDFGRQPFQDLDLLMKLRNKVVHQRPESASYDLSTGTEFVASNLVSQLERRNIIKPLGQTNVPALIQILENESIANWSIATVRLSASEVLNALPSSNVASAAKHFFTPFLVDADFE